jgi:hypothetical protein
MRDEQAIERTVLDYFEGWFDGDPARMERALHPQLAKRAPVGAGKLEEDTAAGMIQMTAEGRGKRSDPEQRKVEVDVVEVYGPIATVVVHSNVYREYLHLGQTDEKAGRS